MLRFYNMKFGDSFLVRDEVESDTEAAQKTSILIDYGSTKAIGKNVSKKIKKDLNGIPLTNNLAVLTHFHEDHYRGFRDEINYPCFQYLLLPNQFFSSDFIFISFFSLLAYSKTNQMAQIAYNLLTSVSCMQNCVGPLSGALVIVGKGTNFSFFSRDFRVLWPDPKSTLLLKKIRKVKADIEKYLEKNDQKEKIKEYLDKMTAEYQSFLEENIVESIVYNISTVRKSDKNWEKDIQLLLKEAPKIRIENNLSLKIRKLQNSLSLVFELTSDQTANQFLKDGITSNCLFLSDIDSKMYESEIFPLISDNHYDFIKISHHGTRDYFSKHLPQATYYGFSNGANKSWGISSLYQYYNGGFPLSALHSVSCDFVCSNNNGCEFYNAFKMACNSRFRCSFGRRTYFYDFPNI